MTGKKAVLIAKSSEQRNKILKSMKRLKIKNLPIQDAMLKRMCEQLSRLLLEWRLSHRLSTAESAVQAFEHILVSGNIFGAEACVEQFLGHLGVATKVSKRPWQDIYFGYSFV